MTTQFLSRTERSNNRSAVSDVGPGDYAIAGTFKKPLPSFAPFSSNAKRTVAVPNPEETDERPAPGSYDLAQDLIKRTNYAPGTYNSKSDRFAKYTEAHGPGPGSYVLPSAFMKKKTLPQSRTDANPALFLSMAAAAEKPPPSIPTRFQSYGYEVAASGDDSSSSGFGGPVKFKQQQPLYPVYKGDGDDRVGPCEYDPKTDLKFKKMPTANFSKAASRDNDKQAMDSAQAPGPGYYNIKSDFDLPEEGNTFTDTSFLMQLTAARQRQSAVFESRTQREGLMAEVRRRLGDPGPGQYNIQSSGLKTSSKLPPGKQNFSSTGPRFEDPLPKSMRLTTAPGAYNPITSDFDQARLKLLKKKKMASRSGWAQTIAFTSTESRFFQHGGDVNEAPAASKYFPHLGMGDAAPKQNVRAGAFGSKAQRFKEKKGIHDPIRDPYYLATRELNRDLAHVLPPAATASSAASAAAGHSRRHFSTVFGPTDAQRVKPPRTPPVPAPGAYDTNPKWDEANIIHMLPSKSSSRKKPESMPGPGQYVIPRGFGSAGTSRHRNRKNIMLSTERREMMKVSDRAPGPGHYDPAPMEGSLLRPSHNVLLSSVDY